MRIDRAAAIYLFHPLSSRRSAAPLRIPILMYHSISEEQDTRHPYFQTTTSPARFLEHVRFLHHEGYATLSLASAIECLRQGSCPMPKPVVITFDDGFEDFYTAAFPALARHGFTASMFLPTAYIGESTRTFLDKPCMTWGQIRELDAAGVEFGSHTVNHPQLRNLSMSEVRRELRDSKAVIEDKLGHPAPTFAYPYAFPESKKEFVTGLREILAENGYRGGVNTVIGTAAAGDDPYFLKRLPANAADDAALFRAKLESGYDWLHGVQRFKKAFLG